MSLNHVASLYTPAQVRRYLSTISLAGFEDRQDAPLPPPTLATLSLLMIHHLTTFAFENTSIHYEPARTVDIDPQAVYRRFVQARKGGYCMQHNLLFLNVLRALGYRAYSVSGRVCEPPSDPHSPPAWTGNSHMVLLVLVDCHLAPPSKAASQALYVVDVGFGAKGLMRPLLLRHGHQERGRANITHRLVRQAMPSSSFDLPASATYAADTQLEHRHRNLDDDDDDAARRDAFQSQLVWRFQAQEGPQGEWTDNYSFTTLESFAPDYRTSNWFTSTSPDSIFTRTLMVVQNAIARLPGGEKDARQMCDQDGLPCVLYPYHPTQIAEDVLFANRLTRRAGGADCHQPAEVIELRDEQHRISTLKHVFRLLNDVSDQEALKAIAGTTAELSSPTT
ncbi:uncharacterized protein PFL1_06805 [Pseudozyma flocculosa PF-1]|uniref:Uncharacterized protein n=2 Tax=Pseudozyma flocculosa TaxID=84751 RepID=A0A5C3F246_9BASI|nr:uncharacterized protein PFL1_06805 [Pseudozyma flocculosa PF-1]EPQ25625.1 hypothetical protein PFL1_06805 [Pseudozyma flocculosa PF-1]SPO38554.1 uncharacterized protein PSFLO_04032 [Pseudozyma flocculosa]